MGLSKPKNADTSESVIRSSMCHFANYADVKLDLLPNVQPTWSHKQHHIPEVFKMQFLFKAPSNELADAPAHTLLLHVSVVATYLFKNN